MKPVLSILLAVLTAAVPARSAVAQDEAGKKAFFRVEAIVFTHADGRSDAWPVQQPADHSAALDPAWQAFANERQKERGEDERGTADTDLEAALSMVETIASLESGEESLTRALLYPEPWLALDELSEPMARARNRLESSGAYRVRTWLAWHHALDAPAGNRPVRIHDGRLVAIDWVTVSPTGRLLRDDRPVETIEDLAPDFHYRLDGSIRLRQRQFMHADVSLDWRVPEEIGPSPWPISPVDAALESHRLEQSRTIRPGRFEYFDSPWLGLLLRVTPYELEPAEPMAPVDPPEEAATP